MLALAVPREGMAYPFFAAELVGGVLDKYLQGKVDLNFVFRTTPVNRLFFFDIQEADPDQIALIRARPDELKEEYYPSPGLFSRAHTHPLPDEHAKNEGRQQFLIDGKWEAADFSGFYGKMADTYSLTYISKNLATASVTEADKVFLRDSIVEKSWQGGGSYAAFYGLMRGRTTSRHPLKVDGIEYHSPGYISVVGNHDVLNHVVAVIERIIENRKDAHDAYRHIHQSLGKEKLLRANKNATFSSEAVEAYVRDRATKLAELVSMPNVSLVFDACEKNTVVFSKVILSYSRRVSSLAKFYIEGRVKTGTSEQIDN